MADSTQLTELTEPTDSTQSVILGPDTYFSERFKEMLELKVRNNIYTIDKITERVVEVSVKPTGVNRCEVCDEIHASGTKLVFTADVYVEKLVKRCSESGKIVKISKCFINSDKVSKMQKYEHQIFRQNLNTLLENTEQGTADVFALLMKDTMVITDTSKIIGYVWDEEKALWIKGDRTRLRPYVHRKLTPFLQAYVNQVQTKLDEGDISTSQRPAFEQDIKRCQQKINSLTKLSHLSSVFILAIPKLFDENFEEKLNNIPYLFPTCDKKVVNLKTCKVEPRMQEHMFSFDCPVALDFCPEKLKKIKEYYHSLFLNNEEMVTYFRRILGYCLSGEIGDRSFYIWYGIGRNGKSQLINFLKKMLTSNWAKAISRSAVIKSNRERDVGKATTEINKLRNCRLAYFNESREGDELNEELLKNISGGDAFPIRLLHNEEIEITTQAKLFLSTNHRAKFNFDDQATMDRVKQIPAPARFVPKSEEFQELKPNEQYQDGKLMTELENELLNAHFTYLVQGCMQYYEFNEKDSSIPVPKECTESVQKLIKDSDTVQAFIDECVIEDDNESVQSSNLHEEYVRFTRNSELKPISVVKFSKALESKGYVKQKTRKGMVWKGISLALQAQF